MQYTLSKKIMKDACHLVARFVTRSQAGTIFFNKRFQQSARKQFSAFSTCGTTSTKALVTFQESVTCTVD